MSAALAVLVCLMPAAPSPSAIADQVARLEGHRVTLAADGSGFVIEDIAGEGKPLVGVVRRRGKGLVLETGARTLELRGPLARPRIAGPNYKVWVLGQIDGSTLVARRLGILAAPGRFRWPAPAAKARTPR
jgi:hypothetical protein